MLYFHSFWTRPLFENRQSQAKDFIELWEFEALTWLLSAMEIRRHSPLRLITDKRGLDFVQNTRLDWVYNGGISTSLETIPEVVDGQIFWAAGKIYAWNEVHEPAVSVDTDAVLWKPLAITSPVMALNLENRKWPWYVNNEKDFARFGFEEPGWDWTVHPLNHGILYIGNDSVKDEWVSKATDFMVRFSEFNRQPNDGRAGSSAEAVLFADQSLLAMCARRMGIQPHPLTGLDKEKGLLVRDPYCLHLWDTKEFYRYSAEARIGLCNYLIEYLLTHHPESRRTLEHWKLDKLQEVDSRMELDFRKLPPQDHRRQRISLLADVNGLVWLLDPNVAVRRKAFPGSLALPGEKILAESGANYRLIPAAETPVG